MVIIGLIAIAVLFLSMICLKHDLDKKQKKLLDEMTKKITGKCQSNQKIGVCAIVPDTGIIINKKLEQNANKNGLLWRNLSLGSEVKL